jgi:hypothetical protein
MRGRYRVPAAIGQLIYGLTSPLPVAAGCAGRRGSSRDFHAQSRRHQNDLRDLRSVSGARLDRAEVSRWSHALSSFDPSSTYL